MQTLKRKRYQKDTSPTDDVLTLIQLVRQNPAIYNYKSHPHRKRVDVLSGWAQIATKIGNKYTVEECRRKWKNLRDTYHQYRLRKSKPGDGLSKWRYAKHLDFLSNVYQPKLKIQRRQNLDVNSQILQVANCSDTNITQNSDDIVGSHHHHHHHQHTGISLENDDAESFIISAYEESVNDDVTIDHGVDGVDELTHHSHDDDHVEEIDKHEHSNSLDGIDSATGAEVDYEEVCFYEEATNPQTTNDCETIINSNNDACLTHDARDIKDFQYIDANEFCIEAINAHTHYSGNNTASIVSGNNKLKNLMKVIGDTNEITTITTADAIDCPMSPPLIQFPSTTTTINTGIISENVREELDLFFDFLKKKIQHFSKEELSAIQIDILNCVLRREAENAQRSNMMTNGHTT